MQTRPLSIRTKKYSYTTTTSRGFGVLGFWGFGDIGDIGGIGASDGNQPVDVDDDYQVMSYSFATRSSFTSKGSADGDLKFLAPDRAVTARENEDTPLLLSSSSSSSKSCTHNSGTVTPDGGSGSTTLSRRNSTIDDGGSGSYSRVSSARSSCDHDSPHLKHMASYKEDDILSVSVESYDLSSVNRMFTPCRTYKDYKDGPGVPGPGRESGAEADTHIRPNTSPEVESSIIKSACIGTNRPQTSGNPTSPASRAGSREFLRASKGPVTLTDPIGKLKAERKEAMLGPESATDTNTPDSKGSNHPTVGPTMANVRYG